MHVGCVKAKICHESLLVIAYVEHILSGGAMPPQLPVLL